MPDPTESETRSERLTLAVTPSEKAALEFICRVHGDKYDGVSSPVRDYSLAEALSFHRRAVAAAAPAA